MLSEREVSTSIGTTAYGANGDKIGTVEQFFVDDRTGAPSWVAVSTGMFGTRHSIVPAVDATFTDGALRVPVTAEAVKNAPHLTGDHLSPAEEDTLRRHYGVGASSGHPVHEPTTGRTSADPGTGRHAASSLPDETVPDDTDRQVTDETVPDQQVAGEPRPSTGTDGGMTRSEEQLVVGTERVATTRARLVKYVVTEDVQITVPIRREEIRVEEVPIDSADAGPGESLLPSDQQMDTTTAGSATGTTAMGGLPGEIILHTERPVVTVEVVPTERVRLRTELVQGQETVTEQVQREQIVVDEDAAPRA